MRSVAAAHPWESRSMRSVSAAHPGAAFHAVSIQQLSQESRSKLDDVGRPVVMQIVQETLCKFDLKTNIILPNTW